MIVIAGGPASAQSWRGTLGGIAGRDRTACRQAAAYSRRRDDAHHGDLQHGRPRGACSGSEHAADRAVFGMHGRASARARRLDVHPRRRANGSRFRLRVCRRHDGRQQNLNDGGEKPPEADLACAVDHTPNTVGGAWPTRHPRLGYTCRTCPSVDGRANGTAEVRLTRAAVPPSGSSTPRGAPAASSRTTPPRGAPRRCPRARWDPSG
jgi:hypothetical protein